MATDEPGLAFAGFRSVSQQPRLQPDPYVLATMDKEIDTFQTEAINLGVGRDFVASMAIHCIQAFTRLDALPRDDPFWNGTNRRPTQYKLYDFCQKDLADNPDDIDTVWRRAAVEIVLGYSYDPATWEKLINAGQVDAGWLLYAALWGECGGSYDTVDRAVASLKKLGLSESVRPTLERLIGSGIEHVSKWAGRVKDGCDIGQTGSAGTR